MLKPEAYSQYGFTPREAEILGLMCDGMSTKHVMRHMGLALRTVEIAVHAGYRRLGVHKDRQAISKLYRERLVELPDV